MRQNYKNPNNLVEWAQTLNSKQRAETTIPFLCHFLRRYRDSNLLLDASSGLGIECKSMIKNGYWMQMNEPDFTMVPVAKSYYDNNSELKYESTTNQLTGINRTTHRYGGIILLGGALATVPLDQQQTVINHLHGMLVAGGTLIIDEINPQIHSRTIDTPPLTIPHPLFPGLLSILSQTSSGSILKHLNPRNGALMHSTDLHHDGTSRPRMSATLKNAGFKLRGIYPDYNLDKKSNNHTDAGTVLVHVAEKKNNIKTLKKVAGFFTRI